MPNRLAKEKSPYLRQHQNNPVDWFPWGEEAFALAKKENKPIFLSIGYSTCHWCHVMEHESFEDPFVATLLNQAFVNVKVDREERPDIDHVYMSVCQLMNGNGGWPLTIIMTPDQKPFFAGTYIPKTTKYGHLGIVDLIPRIQELWVKTPEKIEGSAENIVQALHRIKEFSERTDVTGEILHHGFEFHNQSFDEEWGGFGDHPKFPSLHHLQFLMRYSERFKSGRAQEMVMATLKNIISGGIYDHVGGGIHRYSVDREWFVPHFEKMLYDQAMLIRVLSEAYAVTKDNLFVECVEHTIEYLKRDLLSPEGAFYSGEDADSEGVEGKFYLWRKGEIAEVLGSGFAALAAELESESAFAEPGNFREHGVVQNGNILRFSPTTHGNWIKNSQWLKAREQLVNHRAKRVRPGLDNKILTDWNALTASALAMAGRVFEQPDWIALSEKAISFVEQNLIKEGKLHHRYCEGEVLHLANLDDSAFLIEAYIELAQATSQPAYLKKANELLVSTIQNFWNEKENVFMFTSHEAEKLIVRKAELYDGAYPSGNSTAILSMLKLGKLLGISEYEDRGMSALEAVSGNMNRSPGGYTYLLCALDFAFGPTRELVVVGTSPLAEKLFRHLSKGSVFRDVIHWRRPNTAEDGLLTQMAPFLGQLKSLSTNGTLYVCENFSCKSPIEITEEVVNSRY